MSFTTMRAKIKEKLPALSRNGDGPKGVSFFRHLLRQSQESQILFCIVLGVIVAFITAALHFIVQWSHELTFALPAGEHLSETVSLPFLRVLAVPAAGGLLLGLFALLMRLWRPAQIVDPIEANAVFGGRMSFRDSLRLVFETLISNACGSSVGMEAAYTQIGASVCSRLGQNLQLRREDLRIFVAAGAAAAIAAAFNAPLAGAFYGFELVLGSYTIMALPHIALCALTSALCMRIITGGEPIFSISADAIGIPFWNYPLFVVMGLFSAQLGILTMRLVTQCERIAERLPLLPWQRPLAGGLLLGLIAIAFPQVLGSGQGAIDNHLHNDWPLLLLTLLLAAKIIASAVSIGSGFRGGLFSTSLFLGCLFGQVCGIVINLIFPHAAGQGVIFMLVGMGSVAASIIGAPVTMVLLVLELTGSYAAMTAVLTGVLVASTVTRLTFGYSFSTWRFHLRGLGISGAADIGWISDLTVLSLMRGEARTFPETTPLPELRKLVPPGSTKRIFLVDTGQNYKGMVDVADMHSNDLDHAAPTMTAADMAKGQSAYLLPDQNIREALDAFSKWELEDLPVLSASSGVIIGYLSEPYTLKRYAQELESRSLLQTGARAPRNTPASSTQSVWK